MKKNRVALLSCALLLTLSRVGAGHDRWDSPGGCSDDVLPIGPSADNCNQLLHGKSQLHDVEGAAGEDVDHMLIWTGVWKSYEVRAFSGNQRWSHPGSPDLGFISLSRLDAQSKLVQVGTFPEFPAGTSHVPWQTMRWISTLEEANGPNQYVRVQASPAHPSTAADQYEIEFLETTVYVPRWNNSGGQVTVLFIQSMMGAEPAPFSGSAFFLNDQGALLHTEPIDAAQVRLMVINTANIPALAGKSGSLRIAHTGGWGALNVKAVAVEPATGFTFDTVGSTRPR